MKARTTSRQWKEGYQAGLKNKYDDRYAYLGQERIDCEAGFKAGQNEWSTRNMHKRSTGKQVWFNRCS